MDVIKESNEVYCREKDSGDISEDLVAKLSVEIKNIVDAYIKIDRHDNIDVHNRIAQEIDDLLYDFSKDNNIELDFDQIDKVIESVKAVALRRY